MPTRPARTAICSGDERKHHTREVSASDKVLPGPPHSPVMSACPMLSLSCLISIQPTCA